MNRLICDPNFAFLFSLPLHRDISLSKKVLGHRKKNFSNVYDYNAYDASAFGYYVMILHEVHEFVYYL